METLLRQFFYVHNNKMKLILFLFINVAGFLMTGALVFYTLHNTQITELPIELRTEMWSLVNPGTMIVWIISSVVSILYLFLKNGLKYIFLILPLISPVIYILYILNNFNL